MEAFFGSLTPPRRLSGSCWRNRRAVQPHLHYCWIAGATHFYQARASFTSGRAHDDGWIRGVNGNYPRMKMSAGRDLAHRWSADNGDILEGNGNHARRCHSLSTNSSSKGRTAFG